MSKKKTFASVIRGWKKEESKEEKEPRKTGLGFPKQKPNRSSNHKKSLRKVINPEML